MPFVRFALQVTLAAIMLSPGLVVRGAEPATDLRPRFGPKVLRYDWKTDTFVYASGVFNPARSDRPSPDINYYGNRLSQYRFVGPRSQSGIYGAMDDHKARMKLDPIKYQYRWR